MAGYAEAGAEFPSPWNIPFRIWLKLPELPRRAVVLLVFYPIIAFLAAVTVLQLLSYWINIDPIQRYALRGLGIDKQNLIDTSGVVDTVSVVQFESDVPQDLASVYIKRGQIVGFLAQIISEPIPREQLKVCLLPLGPLPEEGAEIGQLVVAVARSQFRKSIPIQFSREMQSNTLISGKDWNESDELKRFDVNDDVRVTIRYISGQLYNSIPPGAETIGEIPRSVSSSISLRLACEKFKVNANIRIAKPELMLKP